MSEFKLKQQLKALQEENQRLRDQVKGLQRLAGESATRLKDENRTLRNQLAAERSFAVQCQFDRDQAVTELSAYRKNPLGAAALGVEMPAPKL